MIRTLICHRGWPEVVPLFHQNGGLILAFRKRRINDNSPRSSLISGASYHLGAACFLGNGSPVVSVDTVLDIRTSVGCARQRTQEPRRGGWVPLAPLTLTACDSAARRKRQSTLNTPDDDAVKTDGIDFAS